MDMRPTITPKSDQLNADDLIAGPRTVEITAVKAAPGNAEQPVAVYFVGDDGKPYMPCKSMRRVMVAVWGPDAAAYTGRAMTLYRDPSVTWGGMEVGGIRISHMSHMEAPIVLALTATKKARKPYQVRPLVTAPRRAEPVAEPQPDRIKDGADALAARFAEVRTAQEYYAILDEPKVATQMQWLKDKRPELFATVDAARVAAAERMQDAPPPEDERVYDIERGEVV
jgi:hypothetical protein